MNNSLREQICEIGRISYQKGYLAGYEGNISIRMADGNVLITPSGLHKGFFAARSHDHHHASWQTS